MLQNRLLETLIQGEAPSHAIQFAQRFRDTADDELVTLLGNFVAAAYREPDLAEELNRCRIGSLFNYKKKLISALQTNSSEQTNASKSDRKK